MDAGLSALAEVGGKEWPQRDVSWLTRRGTLYQFIKI
jgi:PilZ domain